MYKFCQPENAVSKYQVTNMTERGNHKQNIAYGPNFLYLMPRLFKKNLKIKAALPEGSCGI